MAKMAKMAKMANISGTGESVSLQQGTPCPHPLPATHNVGTRPLEPGEGDRPAGTRACVWEMNGPGEGFKEFEEFKEFEYVGNWGRQIPCRPRSSDPKILARRE